MRNSALKSLYAFFCLILSSTAKETASIDLMKYFGVNADMPGVAKVDGLMGETGNAFAFGEDLRRTERSQEMLQRINKLLLEHRQMVIMANVKVKALSYGTLLSAESRSKGRDLLSVWISCYRSCRLGIKYPLSPLITREVSFHHIGDISDGRWHKIALHVFPHSHPKKTAVDLYVDCKMLSRKKMHTPLENVVPTSRDKPEDILFLFAQRGGQEQGAMLTWKGSLQNVKIVLGEPIAELMNNSNCHIIPPPSVLSDDKDQKLAAGFLQTEPYDNQDSTAAGPSVVVSSAKMQFSTNEVMMVLVQMQKESQRREESLQRSLMKLERSLDIQTIDVENIKETLSSGVCSNRAYSPGKDKLDVKRCSMKPCFPLVDCEETPGEALGFKCGPCPPGYTGDGMRCDDVNECVYLPCSPHTTCINLQPGYRCTECPGGYSGNETMGIGVEIAQRAQQVCNDINECKDGRNGGCSVHSECINTQGSYRCGPCRVGYFGDPYTECNALKYCSGSANPCGFGAICIPKNNGRSYECRCKPGLAGNGILCEVDTDMDGFPDKGLNCSDPYCVQDNCKDIPNTDQEDVNGNGKGDICEYDADDDRYPNDRDNCPTVYNKDQADTDRDEVGNACDNCPRTPNVEQKDTDGDGKGDECDGDSDGDGLKNIFDNCPLVPNRPQRNQDGDRFGDLCDNCPFTANSDQADSDRDGFGDECDWDRDYDHDGVEDRFDNCVSQANGDQLDTDQDGLGDRCDNDDDGDGIPDYNDNCRLFSNKDQKMTLSDTHGDACVGDFDGDGVVDSKDVCPSNPKISRTDFTKYTSLVLDAVALERDKPLWRVNKKGDEIQQLRNSAPGMLIGDQIFEDLEFSGTFFVNNYYDDDIIGFVFGYQNPRKFFIVSWKQLGQVYWSSDPFRAKAKAGANIKKVDSSGGSMKTLRNALWHTGDTPGEVTLLWKDSKEQGWQDKKAYRWQLIYLPSKKTMRLKVWRSLKSILIDSGEINDNDIRGGRLGVMSFSQQDVIWSALSTKCLDFQDNLDRTTLTE